MISGYRVDGVLGQGGTGIVLRVHDEALDRPMALKLLADDLDEGARARFMIEARAAGRIIHPNVVQVFAVGSHEGRTYITQELVEGYPLSSLLEVRGRLSARSVADIGIQAARGLDRAAKTGVVHRDVKPQNLLVTDEGLVKVADFGLAKLLHAPSALTDSGTTLGTPHYMSPEQGLAQELDARSDQYSLGATLYHLLTGRAPFDSDNALALLLKHVQEPIVPILELVPDCPPRLASAIERMLAKKREERFPGFEEVIEALEQSLNGDSDDAGTASIAAESVAPRSLDSKPCARGIPERTELGSPGSRPQSAAPRGNDRAFFDGGGASALTPARGADDRGSSRDALGERLFLGAAFASALAVIAIVGLGTGTRRPIEDLGSADPRAPDSSAERGGPAEVALELRVRGGSGGPGFPRSSSASSPRAQGEAQRGRDAPALEGVGQRASRSSEVPVPGDAREKVTVRAGDPDRTAFDLLIEDLGRDPRAATRAARKLGERGDHAATGPLVEALRAAVSTDVRIAAADALGSLGDDAAIVPLMEAALHAPSPRVRAAALAAKEKLFSVEGEPSLERSADSARGLDGENP